MDLPTWRGKADGAEAYFKSVADAAYKGEALASSASNAAPVQAAQVKPKGNDFGSAYASEVVPKVKAFVDAAAALGSA